jgi:hypothetical protein
MNSKKQMTIISITANDNILGTFTIIEGFYILHSYFFSILVKEVPAGVVPAGAGISAPSYLHCRYSLCKEVNGSVYIRISIIFI